MLHKSALRGFLPANLVIDLRDLIPLPGDEASQFVLVTEERKAFDKCCENNLRILGDFLPLLSRWTEALTTFQEECDLEKKRALESFMNNDIVYFLPRFDM